MKKIFAFLVIQQDELQGLLFLLQFGGGCILFSRWVISKSSPLMTFIHTDLQPNKVESYYYLKMLSELLFAIVCLFIIMVPFGAQSPQSLNYYTMSILGTMTYSYIGFKMKISQYSFRNKFPLTYHNLKEMKLTDFDPGLAVFINSWQVRIGVLLLLPSYWVFFYRYFEFHYLYFPLYLIQLSIGLLLINNKKQIISALNNELIDTSKENE